MIIYEPMVQETLWSSPPTQWFWCPRPACKIGLEHVR